MNARETLDAARQAWERSQPQLFLELNDPAPAAGDSADAHQAILQSRGAPGAGHPLVGGPTTPLPLRRAPSPSPAVRPPTSTTPVTQQPPPARLSGRARVEAWR